ncbi:MAG: hypothetical protein QF705_01275 [Arenicellales bacterium]|jgi:hypothetical protein|nr:hypothetical protein [Arenicellales bacterium]
MTRCPANQASHRKREKLIQQELDPWPKKVNTTHQAVILLITEDLPGRSALLGLIEGAMAVTLGRQVLAGLKGSATLAETKELFQPRD